MSSVAMIKFTNLKIFSLNLPKVVINEKNELIYMSRLAIPGSKKKLKKKNISNKFVFMPLVKMN